MTKMINFLITVAVLFVAVGNLSADPASYSGRVKVDSINVTPGDKFVVNIRLSSNTIALSGLTIPLKYDNPDLTIDSVSFAGTIKPAEISGVVHIDAPRQTVRVSYIPNLQSGGSQFSNTSGILARIFFSLDIAAPSGAIPIDSINVDSVISSGPPTIHFWTRIEFTDGSGTYFYLPDYIPGAIIVSGSTAIGDESGPGLPSEFQLSQNYPNPFNPATLIEFALPSSGHVKLTVFNVLGQAVAILADRQMAAGVHQIEFDASEQPSGIYFYRLSHAQGSLTRKMILVK